MSIDPSGEQFRHGYVQGRGERTDVFQTDVPFPSLDTPDVTTVQADHVREVLLAPAAPPTEFAEPVPEPGLDI